MLYVLTQTIGVILTWQVSYRIPCNLDMCTDKMAITSHTHSLYTRDVQRAFFASFALTKGHGVITGLRSFTGHTEDILACVTDSHTLQTHTHRVRLFFKHTHWTQHSYIILIANMIMCIYLYSLFYCLSEAIWSCYGTFQYTWNIQGRIILNKIKLECYWWSTVKYSFHFSRSSNNN